METFWEKTDVAPPIACQRHLERTAPRKASLLLLKVAKELPFAYKVLCVSDQLVLDEFRLAALWTATRVRDRGLPEVYMIQVSYVRGREYAGRARGSLEHPARMMFDRRILDRRFVEFEGGRLVLVIRPVDAQGPANPHRGSAREAHWSVRREVEGD